MAIGDIPGVEAAGWKPAPPTAPSRSGRTSTEPSSSSSSSSNTNASTLPSGVSTRRGSPLIDMQAKLGAVLKAIKNLKDAWPFLHAVNGKLVPDYYDIITHPMDIEKMENNLNNHGNDSLLFLSLVLFAFHSFGFAMTYGSFIKLIVVATND
jgi:hypothetical protein